MFLLCSAISCEEPNNLEHWAEQSQIVNFLSFQIFKPVVVEDLHRNILNASPKDQKNVFNFMRFGGKLRQNIGLVPPATMFAPYNWCARVIVVSMITYHGIHATSKSFTCRTA